MKTGEIISRGIIRKQGWKPIFSYRHFQVFEKFEKGKSRLRWNKKTKKVLKKYKLVEKKDLVKLGWDFYKYSGTKNWKMFTRNGGEVLFWDSRSQEILKILQ